MKKCGTCEREYNEVTRGHKLHDKVFCSLVCMNIYTKWELMDERSRPTPKKLHDRFMGHDHDDQC